jgi:hypothetical protein
VQAGPKLLVLRPEPRLPRWAVKTELGKEFLHDRCHIHLIDEFKIKEAGIQKAIDGLTDEIGDVDWWISGYPGQLPTDGQRVKTSLESQRNTKNLSSEKPDGDFNQRLEADKLVGCWMNRPTLTLIWTMMWILKMRLILPMTKKTVAMMVETTIGQKWKTQIHSEL